MNAKLPILSDKANKPVITDSVRAEFHHLWLEYSLRIELEILQLAQPSHIPVSDC